MAAGGQLHADKFIEHQMGKFRAFELENMGRAETAFTKPHAQIRVEEQIEFVLHTGHRQAGFAVPDG